MNLQEQPGLLFVAATLLPLASFLLLFVFCGLWGLARRYQNVGWVEGVFHALDAPVVRKVYAYVALGAIVAAFGCSLAGFILFNKEHSDFLRAQESAEETISELKQELKEAEGEEKEAKAKELKAEEEQRRNLEQRWEARRTTAWQGRFDWLAIKPAGLNDPARGTTLQLGFAIDNLSALMFVMVTLIASLIHLFSIGYMGEELSDTVDDHHVPGDPAPADHFHAVGVGHEDDPEHRGHGGHYRRRGRFGRFFMYLSLFCFSMLNLVLADNLFQVFVSWELVGICSYLLIGFYFERTSASNAANKAFIVNRVGDAGFILGLLILWTYCGTFNFQELFRQVRAPLVDAHHEAMPVAGRVVRGDVTGSGEEAKFTLDPAGAQALLFPREGHLHAEDFSSSEGKPAVLDEGVSPSPTKSEFGSIPYWLLVCAGLGIFMGCVGKSAQFPLQVWLPDAMEGPTPVSALIHAATMVAAGVYLVGRAYPLFTPEALLVIAYTGGITLFVAATIAIVMTDIKKVLAYSTVSQLGYMMLALGVGGWVAGLFHLFTHAFFKALLFLGSGSVIYGCHHEQEMTRMGGLYPKMKITALTMLMGVLAIAGIPAFSGWYSKDSILAQAFGFAYVNPQHLLLFLLPLATAGITTFYMFRMWLMTFTGKPRDEHVYEHAHESPPTMTVPLIVLAVFAVCVSWGWPFFSAKFPFLNATTSALERNIHHAQPPAVYADFGHVRAEPGEHGGHAETWAEEAAKPLAKSERQWAHHFHDHAGWLALGMVALGIVFSFLVYYYRALDPEEAKEQFAGIHAFLQNKWRFDELYSVLLVRPAVVVARYCRAFDLRFIDGFLHAVARGTVGLARFDRRIDTWLVDGLVNLAGNVTYAIGARLRVVQTGSLRNYVLFLVLAAVGIFAALTYFVARATAGF